MEDAIRTLALAQRHATARHLCPNCSPERKNKHDHCLSITIEDDHWLHLCHHCGFSGAGKLRPEPRRQFFTPQARPSIELSSKADELSDGALRWLMSRGITEATARKAGVISDVKFIEGENCPVIGFPYREAGKTYAVKWRAIHSKAFTQTGSANTLWLSDRCQKGAPIVITEGEADALALLQAEVPAVSVPNGAPLRVVEGKAGPGDDKKFAYVWAAKELIEAAPKIILAVDGDDPGNALGEELARRIGRAKCWRAFWPDGCKDANDVLRLHGPDVLRECIENAQPWPVKGLYDADHFSDQVEGLYDKGLAKGESTGFANVDDLYTIMPGQLCVVTGIPSMGKSSFVDQVMVNVARMKGWRFAVCSFENEPRIHIAKLCQLYVGKPFFDGPTPRMTKSEYKVALAWVNEHFTFLYQGDGAQSPIEDIIDRLRAAVMRYGIRAASIDPANFVDRPKDMNETDWVSDALTKLKVFIMAHDLHLWFVAHPAKVQRNDDGRYPVPGGYSISGSANWFNKADMGMTVHRPNLEKSESDIHIWKCRFSWVGRTGSARLNYDVPTGRYIRALAIKAPWDED